MYDLPRDLTETLITGYSIPLRHKMVVRFCELEAHVIQPIIQQGDVLTMSSLEIAELTGKDHKHVIRDIRAMLSELIDGPDLDHVYEVDDSRGYTAEIRLPRDLTQTLITGYSVSLRHRAALLRWPRRSCPRLMV